MSKAITMSALVILFCSILACTQAQKDHLARIQDPTTPQGIAAVKAIVSGLDAAEGEGDVLTAVTDALNAVGGFVPPELGGIAGIIGLVLGVLGQRKARIASNVIQAVEDSKVDGVVNFKTSGPVISAAMGMAGKKFVDKIQKSKKF